MNKIATSPPIQPSEKGFQYIPLQHFYEQMVNNQDNVYQSIFSFEPFLEKLKAKKKEACVSSIFEKIPMMPDFEQRLHQLVSAKALETNPENLEAIVGLFFPSLFFENQMGFIGTPFTKNFIFQTPEIKELFTSDRWEIKLHNSFYHVKSRKGFLDVVNVILNTFYGQENFMITSEVMTIRDRETMLEKHYKINIVMDYIKSTALKPLKKLSRKQIHRLTNEFDNKELTLKLLPPENFKFEGLVLGYFSDVTDVEVISEIKAIMAEEGGKSDHRDELSHLENLVRSFLNMKDIHIGNLTAIDTYWQESTTWSLLREFNTPVIRASFKDEKGSYGRLLKTNEPVIVADLKAEKYLSALEKLLLEKNYRSLLLVPMHDEDGQITSIFELASPSPFRFNQLTLYKLKEVISLFAMGANKFIQDLDYKIQLTLQEQFTSIHKSVEWKFKEVATKYFWDKTIDITNNTIEPIVFNDVYPIYGQADIVGSSTLRNESIQEDLIDNLSKVIKVMEAIRRVIDFQLLDVYLSYTKSDLERLEQGEYVSSDETKIVELLSHQIHPLLKQLAEKYPQLPRILIKEYFEALDPHLDIIYRKRKAYEDSVGMLNRTIASFIEEEDEKKQEVIPHFFEKYTGASLLKDRKFSPYFLKDFRLWQLIKMCEVTKLVNQTAKELPVPLQTAQLIFVYNNPLSIRFHMDEKQFDVDGAYNVRYEILKKRIDKALIKGTGERLTLAGKIAIVWLNENDRNEYMEYLRHIRNQGLIAEEIEELELEKLQGAEGLKALRVTVVV